MDRALRLPSARKYDDAFGFVQSNFGGEGYWQNARDLVACICGEVQVILVRWDASQKTLPHPSGTLALVGSNLSFVLERKPNVVETFQQAMSLESVYDEV